MLPLYPDQAYFEIPLTRVGKQRGEERVEWETGALILGIVLGVYAVYTIIPDLLLHRLGLGSWKRQYTQGVALTFDDGPNPKITPQILNVLDRHQVKATFFLVGKEAMKRPDLVREILKRGHQIGMHSQNHRYSWFVSPWRTWQEWNECADTLERIIGQEVQWMRPPWGTFNLATWLWMKRHGKLAVLWTGEGHDWQVRRTPEEIAKRIFSKANEGSIIVMHDNGGDPGAPEHTLEALELVCAGLPGQKKLPWVPLSLPPWTRGRRISYVLFEKWEHIFARLYHVERIDATNLLRLSLIRFNGPDLYDDNDILLARKGDMVGEIHLDSIRLQNKGGDMQRRGIKALRKILESLPVLAAYVENNPKYRDIKVFVGLTLINRGVKGLGFKVQEVEPSFFAKGVGLLQKAIMNNFNPGRKAQEKERLGEQPKLVWISRDALLKRWLPEKDTLDLPKKL